MATASAQPVYRSAAHRRAVMQHIRATLPPAAFAFAAAGPLIGLGLIWGSAFVAMVCEMVIHPASVGPVLGLMWNALVAAYLSAAIPAAITGVWVALLSPFAEDRSPFLAGAASLGAVTAFLFMAMAAPIPGLFGGPLFLAVVGAVAAFLCAWFLQDSVLKRDEARRQRLSQARADRLAKERASA